MGQIKPLFILIFICCAGGLHASERNLPWFEPDVVQAAMEIGMTDEQAPLFGQALTEFVENLNLAVRKLALRDAPNLSRDVRRKRNMHAKKMDAEMAKILSAEQMPKYHIYRDLLISRLSTEVPSDVLESVRVPSAHGL